ncbi:hypothetical protein C6341_g12744 [Phytophthora cactorum]|nr:hypothetical protein C6341_g12744 [Phytophthora cactorum]
MTVDSCTAIYYATNCPTIPSRQSPSSQRTPPRSLPRATSSAVATDTSWRATSRSQRPSRTRSSRTRALQVEHPTFIKTFTRFIEVVAPKLHEEWVASQLDDSSMRALVTSGYTFQNFNCALYATDVAFQQGIAPSGSKAEYLSTRERGNTADITVFRNNEAFHQSARRKADGDHRLADNGPLATDYPEEWTVLADKGYQGLGDHDRCIHSKKGNQLTPEDRRENELISSDRVIVENLLGRCAVYGAFVRSNSAGVNRFMTISSKYT